MIFLISSSGFIMYKSHCSCTGNEQVSVFVQNEVCETQENESCCTQTTTSCCATKEIQQCTSESSDCDCNTPEVTYIKLINKVVKEEVRFIKVDPIQLLIVYAVSQLQILEAEESFDLGSLYIVPPPIHNSSQEFLISIQQLKIPHIA